MRPEAAGGNRREKGVGIRYSREGDTIEAGSRLMFVNILATTLHAC